MHRFVQVATVPVGFVVLVVLIAVIIVLVYWIYRRRRDELEPARRDSLKVPRRPSIYILPITKPLPWDNYRNRRTSKTFPGKAVPIGFIVQEQINSKQCHWKCEPCGKGEF